MSSNMSRDKERVFESKDLVDFCTYNILSSNLASPSHFKNCNPSDLDKEVRLDRIKKVLLKEIANESIIALQEVSVYYSSQLQLFFNDHNYYFFNNNYGSKFSDYMGVGLAFPRWKYDLIDIDSKRIGDKIDMIKKDNFLFIINLLMLGKFYIINIVFRNIRSFFQNLFGYLFGVKNFEMKYDDSWMYSKNRANILLSFLVKEKTNGKLFWVSTYHMPCAFKDPTVMLIHSALALNHLQSLSAIKSVNYKSYNSSDTISTNLPYVLMGDFNFKPTDSMYELYTKGRLDKDHPDKPAQYELCNLNYYESNTDLSVSCVKSAYVEAHGSEPPYTNNAQIRDNPRFVECLDYIFMSKDWTVKFASKIEKLDDEKPFPDEKNPSDHVPISITCEL